MSEGAITVPDSIIGIDPIAVVFFLDLLWLLAFPGGLYFIYTRWVRQRWMKFMFGTCLFIWYHFFVGYERSQDHAGIDRVLLAFGNAIKFLGTSAGPLLMLVTAMQTEWHPKSKEYSTILPLNSMDVDRPACPDTPQVKKHDGPRARSEKSVSLPEDPTLLDRSEEGTARDLDINVPYGANSPSLGDVSRSITAGRPAKDATFPHPCHRGKRGGKKHRGKALRGSNEKQEPAETTDKKQQQQLQQQKQHHFLGEPASSVATKMNQTMDGIVEDVHGLFKGIYDSGEAFDDEDTLKNRREFELPMHSNPCFKQIGEKIRVVENSLWLLLERQAFTIDHSMELDRDKLEPMIAALARLHTDLGTICAQRAAGRRKGGANSLVKHDGDVSKSSEYQFHMSLYGEVPLPETQCGRKGPSLETDRMMKLLESALMYLKSQDLPLPDLLSSFTQSHGPEADVFQIEAPKAQKEISLPLNLGLGPSISLFLEGVSRELEILRDFTCLMDTAMNLLITRGLLVPKPLRKLYEEISRVDDQMEQCIETARYWQLQGVSNELVTTFNHLKSIGVNVPLNGWPVDDDWKPEDLEATDSSEGLSGDFDCSEGHGTRLKEEDGEEQSKKEMMTWFKKHFDEGYYGEPLEVLLRDLIRSVELVHRDIKTLGSFKDADLEVRAMTTSNALSESTTASPVAQGSSELPNKLITSMEDMSTAMKKADYLMGTMSEHRSFMPSWLKPESPLDEGRSAVQQIQKYRTDIDTWLAEAKKGSDMIQLDIHKPIEPGMADGCHDNPKANFPSYPHTPTSWPSTETRETPARNENIFETKPPSPQKGNLEPQPDEGVFLNCDDDPSFGRLIPIAYAPDTVHNPSPALLFSRSNAPSVPSRPSTSARPNASAHISRGGCLGADEAAWLGPPLQSRRDEPSEPWDF